MQAAVAAVLAVAVGVRFGAIDDGVQDEAEPMMMCFSGLGGRDWQTRQDFGSS